MSAIAEQSLSISAVERETGISKDVLRKWESRYGFPAPLRDDQGERSYPPDQVARLRLIKRLMDTGLRPSRIVGESVETLDAMARSSRVTAPSPAGEEVAATTLAMLRGEDPAGLRQRLRRELLSRGVTDFVQDTLTPLSEAVGEAWARGEIGIHEEHLYTEVVQGLLRDVIANLSDPRGQPRIGEGDGDRPQHERRSARLVRQAQLQLGSEPRHRDAVANGALNLRGLWNRAVANVGKWLRGAAAPDGDPVVRVRVRGRALRRGQLGEQQ